MTSNEMKNFKKPKIQKTKKPVSSLIEELRKENHIPQISKDKIINISSEYDEYNELEKLLEKQRLLSQKKNLRSTEEIIENFITESKDEKGHIEKSNLFANQFSNKDSKEGKWFI